MKKIILLVLISIVGLSCKKDEIVDSGAKLRLKNETSFPIESASIKLGNSQNSYGFLNPNELSDYKNFTENTYPNIK